MSVIRHQQGMLGVVMTKLGQLRPVCVAVMRLCSWKGGISLRHARHSSIIGRIGCIGGNRARDIPNNASRDIGSIFVTATHDCLHAVVYLDDKPSKSLCNKIVNELRLIETWVIEEEQNKERKKRKR